MSIKSLKAGNRNFSGLTGQVPEHHVLLQEQSVSSGSSVTFSNISQDYTHLQLRWVARNTGTSNTADDPYVVYFNGDNSAANYSSHSVSGNGTSASSGAWVSGTWGGCYIGGVPQNGTTASSFGAGIVDILDYTNTSKNKTCRALNGIDTNGIGSVQLASGVRLNTAAITSLTFSSVQGRTFSSNCTFQLYGVK